MGVSGNICIVCFQMWVHELKIWQRCCRMQSPSHRMWTMLKTIPCLLAFQDPLEYPNHRNDNGFLFRCSKKSWCWTINAKPIQCNRVAVLDPGQQESHPAFVVPLWLVSVQNESSLREPTALDISGKLLQQYATDGFVTQGEPVMLRVQVGY